MNLIRNILILIAVVVIGIMAVQFLSNIVPIIITAVAAFILGRLSVHYDLLGIIRARMAAAPAQAAKPVAVEAAPKAAAKPAPAQASKPAAAPAAAKTEQAAERLADEPQKNSILLDEDFEVKTPEQIEAEARRREQELAQKSTTPNPDAVQAALEERRKRLLGGGQE